MVYRTKAGTQYLREPQVRVAAVTVPTPRSELFADLLGDYDSDLGFDGYLTEERAEDDPAELIMSAGQLCYASWGAKRSRDLGKYIAHLIDSGHLSVLEHVQVSFLVWGVSRSCVMEWDRHRHQSFSQMSQRFCDGKTLRFVMRPEMQGDVEAEKLFGHGIDLVAEQYAGWAQYYEDTMPAVAGESKTDRRKRINGAARWCLPNCTEVVMMVSANLSAWRHFLTLRCAPAAEREIRRASALVLDALKGISPSVFADMRCVAYKDGDPVMVKG
jgi:thymidylate synthase (FAD)